MNQLNTGRVAFIIVTRNSQRFMPSCLESILNQTDRDFQIAVIDNDSSDGTAAFVRANYPMVSVIENNKNLGFSKANNQGIRLFRSPYLVFCNPDIILEPDWLEKIMAKVEKSKSPDEAVFGGKLLKLKMVNQEIGDFEKTDKIDSCGLKLLKNHRVVELGANEPSADFQTDQEVFGHSGALALFKREALESIVIQDKFHPQGDIWDGNFFFYKEDVDLAYRLRIAGFKSFLVVEAIAYHLRTFSAGEKQAVGEYLANRRNQNQLARYYSYRNHLLCLLEDVFIGNLFHYSPQIVWLELKKIAYVAIFETRSLLAWLEIIKLLPEIISKRRQVFFLAKISAKEIRQWFN